MAKTDIKGIASTLWDKPSKQNWEKFAKALKGSGIKYYNVVFENGGKLNKAQDLTKSYAELYDAKEKMVAKIPIFQKDGGKPIGATVYIKDLIGLRRSTR